MDQEEPPEHNQETVLCATQLHSEMKAYVSECHIPLLEELDIQNLCDFLQDVHLK